MWPVTLLVSIILIASFTVIGVARMYSITPVKSFETDLPRQSQFQPCQHVEDSGYSAVNEYITSWKPDATSEEIRKSFDRFGYKMIEQLDEEMRRSTLTPSQKLAATFMKATVLNYEGEPKKAYAVLEQIRSELEQNPSAAQTTLYTVIYLQGVTSLRRGENENCIMCRGESSCILPISQAAIHIHPNGSRQAIHHFMEYFEEFPDDLAVRWLLNVAHMTLGKHPTGVDPRFVVSLDHYLKNEFNIGKFHDIGHKIGVISFTQAGGAIMDDFDNDGLLDLVTTTFDPTSSINIYRNNGKGTFDNQTSTSGVSNQYGGLNCVQTDYNNDGYLDIFVIRGAWLSHPMRPSLLRNNKDGTFTDVTDESGLMYPANSIAAQWADYDNAGWICLSAARNSPVVSIVTEGTVPSRM
jgi:hypothetical protein